jgi:hypothetical protein
MWYTSSIFFGRNFDIYCPLLKLFSSHNRAMSGKSFLLFLTLLASLSFISCAPFDVDLPFNSPSNQEAEQSKPIQVHFTIHGSCNVTQSATLHRAFLELRGVASNVSDYIHLNGNQAPLFLTYFGQGADQSVPTNYYDRIAKVRYV